MEAALGERLLVIEHIGSTAVPELDAKPIIDLMLGLGSLEDGARCARMLGSLGYEHRGEAGVSGRIFLRTTSPRACHLNMVVVGGEFWESHLLFRDYLRTHPEIAGEYARPKHELAARFRDDREAYTKAKSGFVGSVVGRARVSGGRSL